MFNFFSQRSKNLTDTTVINTLKAASNPKIISFAGGAPSPKTFPLKKLKKISQKLFDNPYCFQYQSTQGIENFLLALADYLSVKWQKTIKPENILVTSGSQQAIDLLGKALLNPHDKVLTERPSYFVALQALSAYEPQFQEINLAENQFDLKKLTKILRTKPKLFYLIPSFQNPTGQTLNLKQRQALVSLANNFPQTLFVEDAAYSEIFFNEAYPDLVSFSSNIIHLGTFSKTLAPGLRLGYIVGPQKIIQTLTLIKQSMDLHTNSLSQLIIGEILKEKEWFQKHLERIRKFYRHQAKTMGILLKKNLVEKASWSTPQGGLFYWLKTNVNTAQLYQKAIKKQVAFVPGHVFFAKKPSYNFMRLSFATVEEEKMKKGLKILSNLIL